MDTRLGFIEIITQRDFHESFFFFFLGRGDNLTRDKTTKNPYM